MYGFMDDVGWCLGWSFRLSWCSLVFDFPKLAYSKNYSLSLVPGGVLGMMAGSIFFWKAFSQPNVPYVLGGRGSAMITRSYLGICCGNRTNRSWNCSLLSVLSVAVIMGKILGEEEKIRVGRKRGKTTHLCLETMVNSVHLLSNIFLERCFYHKHMKVPQ